MKKETFLDGNFQQHNTHGILDTTRVYRKYREKWNTYPVKRKVATFPIHLDIELNTTCNLKCVMCFQSFDPPEAQLMDLEMVKQIILEGAKYDLCSIKLNYRGEPLLYPHLIEVIKFAKQMGVIEVMFNTNGMLLDINKAAKLVKSGVDLIIFSKIMLSFNHSSASTIIPNLFSFFIC